MPAAEQTAHLANVPVELEVELGRKTMTVAELLRLAPGSVIRLPRSAGDNIDVLAGGHVFASGEVIVVEERFGVRITDFKEES